ncbi:uncharacterized protein BT62DRAFT_937346 [Guyanagaster necrorhizus]|uniref:Uncharacterized protein n=1 Tax=Guyanagaster necrorhizus TaxID=856835 RepID=A0A9P7VHF5_9AGAR|nr:uncharacterized protein BT62DRAFT_937346 [Guyanagaster necrorhizus MCA 3950]KAG7441106.1 hypothetical protein BT62DRAFT_937346 [Guyanagaster necrorhizus MCA 3950]
MYFDTYPLTGEGILHLVVVFRYPNILRGKARKRPSQGESQAIPRSKSRRSLGLVTIAYSASVGAAGVTNVFVAISKSINRQRCGR